MKIGKIVSIFLATLTFAFCANSYSTEKEPKIPAGSAFYETNLFSVKEMTGSFLATALIDNIDTILDLKKLLAKFKKIPVQQQKIFHAGQELPDAKILKSDEINNWERVHLVVLQPKVPILEPVKDIYPKDKQEPFDKTYGLKREKGPYCLVATNALVRHRSLRLDQPTVSTDIAENNEKIIEQIKSWPHQSESLYAAKNLFLSFLHRFGVIEHPELFNLTFDENVLDIAQILYVPGVDEKAKKGVWIPTPPKSPPPPPKSPPPARAPIPKNEPPAYGE